MNLNAAETGSVKFWSRPLVLAGIAAIAVAAGIGAILLTLNRSKSVADLAAELRAPDVHTRHLAARQLAKLGPQAKDAVPELTEALKDSDKSVRHYAAKSLAEIGLEAKSATSALIDDLGDPDSDTRYYVVKALSKVELDKSHAHAVPGLIKTLKDENAKTRYYSAKCLKGIGPAASAAIPALKVAVNDEDKEVKETAATALKKITRTH